MVNVTQLQETLYALDDGHVRQFLFLGGGEALLVDTGFPGGGVAEAVRRLTDAPVEVVLTHGDRDHTGGLADFGGAWLHEGDWPLVDAGVPLRPLREGDIFRCGGYRLEVLEIPGHTAGSVALVDWARRLLLPGDSVQKGGPIFLFGGHRDPARYVESLRKLLPLAGKVDALLPCHHACPIDSGYIEKDLADAEALLAGRLPGEPEPGRPCWRYHGRWVDFYGEIPADA